MGETLTWVGGGFAAVLLYVLISNTLWLVFGSRLLQSLPGVDIKGFRGTLKIATMLVLSLVGFTAWAFKVVLSKLIARHEAPSLKREVSVAIKWGARGFKRSPQ